MLLRRHKKQEVPEAEEVFTCTLCEKTYKTQKGLDEHIKKVHEEETDK